ncbi:MAG: serine hydrolase domain-containing protein [Pseudomonadota bacterium]
MARQDAITLEDSASVAAWIDGHVEWQAHSNMSASGVVAVLQDGELIYSRGFGFQDREEGIPVDPDSTLFRPGSISKLFTWVAVMQQVEAGNLDLDTDVNEYLSNFQIEDTYDEPITLRHIMTHTPGFEDGGLGYLVVVEESYTDTLEESMRRFQPARVNPPGAHTAYSNYATALAGLIVQNVSGQPFNDYVQENIFDVLGMENSTFEEPLPEHYARQEAIGYQVERGEFAGKDFEIVGAFGPAGGLSSTSTDIMRFAQAIINGGELDGRRILSEATTEQMLSRAFSHDERMMGLALGFYETDQNGIRIVGHGGDLFHAHSDLAIDLGNRIAIFSSFTGNGGSAVRASIVPAFYDKFFPRIEAPPAIPDGFAERAEKYAGMYHFWRQNFSTIERVRSLSPGMTVAPTDDGALTLASGGGAKQYVEIEKNLFRERDSTVMLTPRLSPRLIAFQEDQSGDIQGMVIDGLPFMSLYKSPGYANTTFNVALLLFSLIVFAGVLLRLGYRWSDMRELNPRERAAVNASILVAVANLLFVGVAISVVATYQMELFIGLPFVFKAMLVLPIVAFAAGIYHAYRLIGVWKDGLFNGVWSRVRFSFVTLAALAMCWFYYFWNILGFQYLA